jgi:hypothetical protein
MDLFKLQGERSIKEEEEKISKISLLIEKLKFKKAKVKH